MDLMTTVQYVSRTIRLKMTIDTGYEGGLMLPQAYAHKLGAPLVEPRRLPRTLTGEDPIPGLATIVKAKIEGTRRAVQTILFCPADATRITARIVGEYFLATVGTTIVVAGVDFDLPEPPVDERLNPSRRLDPYNLGWMHIPVELPRRW